MSLSFTAIASCQKPPSKKQKKAATEPNSNLPLPDDLVLECLARLSRLHYPILSFVSTGFRSLTASPELYQTRSRLNRTEKCLYVCLQFPTEANLRWFTLCRKPDKTLINRHKCEKKETSSGNVLAPVQILNSSPVGWTNLVDVGHKLYAINKEDDAPSSSNVFYLDCRMHKWVETPALRLVHTKRKFDGIMYLAGSYENPDFLNCVEVFDTETETWKAVPDDKRIFRATDFEGKVYKNFDRTSGQRVSLVAKVKDLTVDWVNFGNVCLIEKRFYRYKPDGEFGWSNKGSNLWRKLEGLEGLPRFAHYSNVNVVDFGGMLMVLWDKYVRARGGYKEKMIWCAAISLEIRSSEEVWGKVEWFDAVLKVPKSYKFVYAIAATI